jgi:hypothetical protein
MTRKCGMHIDLMQTSSFQASSAGEQRPGTSRRIVTHTKLVIEKT